MKPFHVKHGYFVTGTGTGVGKTFVTTTLTRLARASGSRVFAFKPIETGCQPGRSGLDQQALVEAAGDWQQGLLAGVYRFEPAVAPLVAANAAEIEIELPPILEALEIGSANVDTTLVEGAGGWRVPITQTLDMSGLAKACGFPIIVVATAVLGTINHSLLTVEAIERDGQAVAGIVLSQLPSDDPQMVASNLEQIRARWPGLVLVLSTDPSVLTPFLPTNWQSK